MDDCTGVGMERDSAHADGSREHISKVCSQLIIGTLLPRPPLSRLLSLSPPPRIAGRMRYQGLKLALLPRTNLHGNRPCAGAIYGGRQIAKRTGAGRTWLSMLCAQFSQLHSRALIRGGDASMYVCMRREKAQKTRLSSRTIPDKCRG